MASGDRRPVRLSLLLLWVVTSSLFSTGLCGGEEYAVCNTRCCIVEPNCSAALQVTCNYCQNEELISLWKGIMSETVRNFTILNTRQVVIDKDAINGLHSLTNFTLSGIDKLIIKQDGMASQEDSYLRSVTIQNVRSLQVESKAFSGVWQPKTSIRMHRIGRLNVESNAFDYQVKDEGPSVSLQHVEMLNLKPNGLAALIFELDVYNVTMDVCHERSFGGNTLNTELNNMTIAEARARCFFGLDYSATFHIQDLKMKTVQTQAFSGNMSELIIEDSDFIAIHEKGFNIRVNSMELSTSYIHELRSRGMSVLAKDSLMLDTVRVDYLQRNALVGLQMKRNKEEFDQPLIIRKLELIETEHGSLTFEECTKVRLTDLMIMIPWPQICPTEKWTQALSDGGVSGQLSPAQYQLFFHLYRIRNCNKDGLKKFPVVVENHRCESKGTRAKRDASEYCEKCHNVWA